MNTCFNDCSLFFTITLQSTLELRNTIFPFLNRELFDLIKIYVRDFTKFQITVGCGLQFHWFLRTLSLKFQTARTKIEVCLSLPCWLSQLNREFTVLPKIIIIISYRVDTSQTHIDSLNYSYFFRICFFLQHIRQNISISDD